MKRILLITAIVIETLVAKDVLARMPYNVTTLTSQPYVALNGAPVFNPGIWNIDSNYTIPTGFNYKIDSITLSNLYLSGGTFAASTATGSSPSIVVAIAYLEDRGTIGGISKSPVRAVTTGVAGSRICKLEVANAAFRNERTSYGTNLDSVNYQVWIYETSNIIELHFGPSSVTHYTNYFGQRMLCGYIKETGLFPFTEAYFLYGDPNQPTVDSVINSPATRGLSAWPANGVVYRFTPKGNPTAVGHRQLEMFAKVYPTECTDKINVSQEKYAHLQYVINSVTGATIKTGNIGIGNNEINLSELTQGVYVLKLITPSKSMDIRQFIKQ